MNNLYDDPQFREKVAQTKADIQKIKEQHYAKDEERKSIKLTQAKIIEEMSKLNTAKQRIRQKKINLENGVKSGFMGKSIELQEECNVIRNRNKVIESIQDKKDSKLKSKLTDQEKHMKYLEKEIRDTYAMLREKTSKNEKLSQEVKQLKKMLPKQEKDLSKVAPDNNDLETAHNVNSQHDLGIQGSEVNEYREKDEDDDVDSPRESIGL